MRIKVPLRQKNGFHDWLFFGERSQKILDKLLKLCLSETLDPLIILSAQEKYQNMLTFGKFLRVYQRQHQIASLLPFPHEIQPGKFLTSIPKRLLKADVQLILAALPNAEEGR